MHSPTKYEHDHAPLVGSEHGPHRGAAERSAIVAAESMLRSSAARRDRGRLEWLLHDDFTGVTRRGEPVSRDQVLDAVRSAAPRTQSDFTRWTFHHLPWPLALATYELDDDTGDTLHTSVWDISTGLARLRFHLGTWEPADLRIDVSLVGPAVEEVDW
jgi:hypothetical protein